MMCHLQNLNKKNSFTQKAKDPYLLLVLSLQGIWHSRLIVERVTQSLRRIIYDTPKGTCRIGTILPRA